MKRWTALLTAVFLMITLCACDSSTEVSAKKWDIVVVPRVTEGEVFRQINEGVAAYAAEHADVNVYQSDLYEIDGMLQSQLVEDLVAQEVDAICVIPIDTELVDPMLKKARDAGIAVVSYDGAELNHVDFDIEDGGSGDPAETVKAMIELAVRVLNGETVSGTVNLDAVGYEELRLREGSGTILEKP